MEFILSSSKGRYDAKESSEFFNELLRHHTEYVCMFNPEFL
jgi:hypothetical protein